MDVFDGHPSESQSRARRATLERGEKAGDRRPRTKEAVVLDLDFLHAVRADISSDDREGGDHCSLHRAARTHADARRARRVDRHALPAPGPSPRPPRPRGGKSEAGSRAVRRHTISPTMVKTGVRPARHAPERPCPCGDKTERETSRTMTTARPDRAMERSRARRQSHGLSGPTMRAGHAPPRRWPPRRSATLQSCRRRWRQRWREPPCPARAPETFRFGKFDLDASQRSSSPPPLRRVGQSEAARPRPCPRHPPAERQAARRRRRSGASCGGRCARAGGRHGGARCIGLDGVQDGRDPASRSCTSMSTSACKDLQTTVAGVGPPPRGRVAGRRRARHARCRIPCSDIVGRISRMTHDGAGARAVRTRAV